ncbi:hypothetical protein [Pelosinus fermentans]|uniref:Uncharacterized protein n=1 Tax=Pelosinus fermentans JBW45 TaxID=1192197 RepID=I9NUB2_9FIRM|nr:hypothetical protein [Pelosinus fermentans]AJQ29966.1 hypothetical protein JBW_04637 [Pelosinus fermentans JBW45]
MMHSNPAIGIAFGIAHVAAAGGFFYLLYHIAKSLRRIANHLDKQ